MTKKKKGFLIAAFTAAAALGVTAIFAPAVALAIGQQLLPLAAGWAAGAALTPITTPIIQKAKFWLDRIIRPTGKGVPLTEGEATALKSVFGQKMKTKRIRKYFTPKEKRFLIKDAYVAAQTYDTKKVKFFGPEHRSDDYSKTTDVFKYGLFFHEMTHTRQFKNPLRFAFSMVAGPKGYEYDLTEKSRFSKFGVEQQASLVQDYAVQFLYQGDKREYAPVGGLYPVTHGGDFRKLSDLQKVVEEKFPEARKTRLALEAKRKPAAAPKAA